VPPHGGAAAWRGNDLSGGEVLASWFCVRGFDSRFRLG